MQANICKLRSAGCDVYDSFALIGHFKKCAGIREPRGVLNIKRYGTGLTPRVSMGDGGSWAPGNFAFLC